MRAELRRSDEAREVARAAEAWRAAGAIEAAELAAIRARFPDDRRRARPAFRALFFLLTLLAGLGVWGFCAVGLDLRLFGAGDEAGHATLLALLAAATFGAARFALGRLRLRGYGVEEALVALALGFEVAALVVGLDGLDVPGRGIAFAAGCNLAAAALAVAWRWGTPGSGALAAAGVFLALGTLPGGRGLWIGAALALGAAARRIGASERVALAHRRRADEVFVVAVFALYVAVHTSIAAGRLFALLADRPGTGAALDGVAGALGWLAMGALPVALLVDGAGRRDRLALGLGALLGLATGTTLLDALDARPVWAVLLAAGGALGALALLLRHALGRRPGRELGGLTDRALYEATDGRSWIEIAATLAALAPAPRRQDEMPAFRGEGGEFGGGGASTKF